MTVTFTVNDAGIGELVVDSPPVNAFSIGDLEALRSHLRSVEGNPDVRAILLRSEGRGFCGGGDVKEVQSLPGFDGILGQARGSLEASLAVAECAVPVVAAVHEFCIGVGVLVAGSCDVIVAGEGTRFVLAEADNGATSGVAQALGLLPEKRVRAAMFTCEPFFAEELLSHGSVYRLTDPSGVVDEARRVAAVIAAKRPRVIRGLKASMNASTGVGTLRQRYRAELSYTFELNMLGDAADARASFLDGRRSSYLDDGATAPDLPT